MYSSMLLHLFRMRSQVLSSDLYRQWFLAELARRARAWRVQLMYSSMFLHLFRMRANDCRTCAG
jgi:hypothetical protein